VSWKVLGGLLLLVSFAQAETLEDAVGSYLALDGDNARRYVHAAESDGEWTKLTGVLGITVTDGNSDTITVAVAFLAEREWSVWKLGVGAAVIYAESSGVETASEWIFTERLDRKLNEKSSIFQMLFAEHDEQELLRIRLRLTFGYTRRLVDKEKFWLEADVGGGVLYEEFRNPDTDETEGIAQIGVRWEWKLTDKLLYKQAIQVYPSLSNGGEFQLLWVSEFTTPISDRWNLSLAIIDTYDSEPPAGNKSNDLKVILSLTVDFAKKEK
jgi:putative salt-induced outer membrane protein YdiY